MDNVKNDLYYVHKIQEDLAFIMHSVDECIQIIVPVYYHGLLAFIFGNMCQFS